MYDPYTADIACGKLVKRYYIFRVVVFDFKKIGNLPI